MCTGLLGVSKDCGKQSCVGKIFGSETVDEKPMKDPRNSLSVLLGRSHIPLSKLSFNEFPHLFKRGVFNNISAFSVENLTGKKPPENLKHQFRILLRLVYQNFFEREKTLFSILVLSLFVKDFRIVLEFVTIINGDVFLLFKTLKSESVFFSKGCKFRTIKNIKKF